MKKTRWPVILPSMIDAAERDPQVADLQARLNAGFAGTYRKAVERAKARGEIGADVDADWVAASIMGPLFYRRWFSRQETRDADAQALMDEAVERARSRRRAD